MQVPFDEPMSPSGSVEQWLGLVEKRMRSSVRHQIIESLKVSEGHAQSGGGDNSSAGYLLNQRLVTAAQGACWARMPAEPEGFKNRGTLKMCEMPEPRPGL